MHLVKTVTEDHQIAIGLRSEAYGEVDRALMAVLTPKEARAHASQCIQAAEIAERRAAQAARK